MVHESKSLNERPDVLAPDGSEVRILSTLGGGSMAHFTLPARAVSIAVAHRTVEEVWFFVSGEGQMWRSRDGIEDIVQVRHGVSLSIPVGVHFQFRSDSDEPLVAVAVTMPPWPGPDEAYIVDGPWTPTVDPSQPLP